MKNKTKAYFIISKILDIGIFEAKEIVKNNTEDSIDLIYDKSATRNDFLQNLRGSM